MTRNFLFFFARREFLKNFMGRENIGKPKENQCFLQIAHERKPKSVKKTVFPEVPTAQKCCKKQYEINIFVVRGQKKT